MTGHERAKRARWAYYGGRCWMCGQVADTWDHVKPRSRGGPDLASNLRPACFPCNMRKGPAWPVSTSTTRWLALMGVVVPVQSDTERLLIHVTNHLEASIRKRDRFIVNLRREGATLRFLAELAGTSAPTIQRILRDAAKIPS